MTDANDILTGVVQWLPPAIAEALSNSDNNQNKRGDRHDNDDQIPIAECARGEIGLGILEGGAGPWEVARDERGLRVLQGAPPVRHPAPRGRRGEVRQPEQEHEREQEAAEHEQPPPASSPRRWGRRVPGPRVGRLRGLLDRDGPLLRKGQV